MMAQNYSGFFFFSIEDNGIGMTKDVQKRVVDKFFRVTTGNVHNIKGFGLGLSYVKAIVLARQGEIRFFSEPGKRIPVDHRGINPVYSNK
ncbi:MAG: ATP-binding protein [Bacteroidota bacterium]